MQISYYFPGCNAFLILTGFAHNDGFKPIATDLVFHKIRRFN